MTPADAEDSARDRAALERLQRQKLSRLVEVVLRENRFYRAKFAGVRFDAERDPLSVLPFTTRAEIEADQRLHPPYGANLTYPVDRYSRMHQTSASSGGAALRWLDTPESWEWWKGLWRIIYAAAGVTAADRVIFPFSFGPFIGFWSAFDAAESLGVLCLAAGGMTSSARLRMITEHSVTVICCTPTYALRMAEQAVEERLNLAASPVRSLIVAGEPGGSISSVRARIETAWGARVFDHAGMTEIGPWGVEFQNDPGGLHVIETEFIPEVVDPATGATLADGSVGELVLTNLGRLGSPLIRYRTGDLVQLTRSAARRWAFAAGGVLGRSDDMLIIRGNNVFPAAVEGILREFDDVLEYRLRVSAAREGGLSELTIEIEPRSGAAASLAERVGAALRDRLHFRPTVVIAPPGTLPRFELKAQRILREANPC